VGFRRNANAVFAFLRKTANRFLIFEKNRTRCGHNSFKRRFGLSKPLWSAECHFPGVRQTNRNKGGETMAQIIRALLGFYRLSDNDLATRVLAVVKGMTGNAILSNPPYTIAALQTALDAFVHAIPAALDGSRKAIAEKDNKRKTLEKMVKLVAAYVELAAGDDLAIFLSSGLERASMFRSSAQPMSPVSVRKIEQGVSGQLLGFAVPAKGALQYEWRYTVVNGSGPADPGTTQLTPTARFAVAFNNLTPGTIYALQVRALGKLGFSEWSAPVSRMVI
jgi:hypothetical protein